MRQVDNKQHQTHLKPKQADTVWQVQAETQSQETA